VRLHFGEWIGGLLLCGWVLALAGCGSSERDPPLEAPFSKKTFTLEMDPGVTMEFVAIPPGRFMMGGGAGNLKPRKVSLCKPYYMGKYEVTQQQWMAVMNTNPSAYKDDPNLPVHRLERQECSPSGRPDERQRLGTVRHAGERGRVVRRLDRRPRQ